MDRTEYQRVKRVRDAYFRQTTRLLDRFADQPDLLLSVVATVLCECTLAEDQLVAAWLSAAESWKVVRAELSEAERDTAQVQERARLDAAECIRCHAMFLQHNDALFDYMVRDEVWTAAGLVRDDFACFDCLEAQLGRPIQAADLVDAPINRPLLFALRRYAP